MVMARIGSELLLDPERQPALGVPRRRQTQSGQGRSTTVGPFGPGKYTIHVDGARMVLGWRHCPRGRDNMVDADRSEKITINVGLVDLGQIDLLVSEGFFANRTDFIRTAIRRQLESRSDAVERTVARRELVLGIEHYSRDALEQLRDSGRMVELRVLGLATIADDVSPELALATIARVDVLGAFRAPRAVKAALASRTT
jgi:Arc/MetJ-type ribon-helix-helix transcriptional regulator